MTPRLDLDWEEGLFRGLLSLWRRVRRPPAKAGPAAALLERHHRALSTLAQVLAGEPVRVIAARSAGGVRGRDLLIPSCFDAAPDADENRDQLVVRTAISAAMRRALRREPAPECAVRELESLRRARRAVDALSAELPGFARRYEAARTWALHGRPDPDSLRGRARLLERARRAALAGEQPWRDAGQVRALESARAAGPESPGIPLWGEWLADAEAPAPAAAPDAEPAPAAEITSEAEAPAVDALARVELDAREQEDAVLIHTFEKAEALDSYQGGARDTDGADELDAHLEALEEVALGALLRSDDPTHSVLRADLALGVDVPDVGRIEPGERGIAYDEWDGRRGRYRKDWCTVYPTPLRAGDPRWAREALPRHARQIRDLRRRLEAHRAGLRPLDRQLDGDDVDVSALVDAYGTWRAGGDVDGRLYVRQARRRRDFATTVLIDVSLSTDSWIEDRRVLDVAREAVLVLGEVADQLGDRLRVSSFASHTRNRCRVWEVKGWREPWHVGRDRLGALRPQGYTRIGPALRHAARELAAEPAERRLLLLVSDGKPTDYDRYEGPHGIADVRQALREAERIGVCTHALAVDAVARDYLPPMFGPAAWHVLPHPDPLAEVLTTVYGRLTGR